MTSHAPERRDSPPAAAMVLNGTRFAIPRRMLPPRALRKIVFTHALITGVLTAAVGCGSVSPLKQDGGAAGSAGQDGGGSGGGGGTAGASGAGGAGTAGASGAGGSLGSVTLRLAI